MKRTTLMITMTALTCFLASGTARAEIPSDMRTDLTGGEDIAGEYLTTPVRQGSLRDVTDSKWLNQPVSNAKGEQLGKIIKMMKDEKTHNIEYVFFHVAGTRYARPMRWSQFEQKGAKLTLNMTKEQLLPPVNRTEVKDMSPDLAMYMDEIEQKRAELNPAAGKKKQ